MSTITLTAKAYLVQRSSLIVNDAERHKLKCDLHDVYRFKEMCKKVEISKDKKTRQRQMTFLVGSFLDTLKPNENSVL